MLYKKRHKNIAGFLIISFFLYGIEHVYGTGKDIMTSVEILNPLGPSIGITAIPEKRITNVSAEQINNKSTTGIFKIFPVNSDRTNPENIILSFSVTTNDDGKLLYHILEELPSNTYDISLKGYSHLTRVLRGVTISGGHTNLDFTSNGTNQLLSGDINLTNGDDEINALDVSVLVGAWNTNNTRFDLNQDEEVNSIDISNLLANFNLTGD